jgi:hypothetical protein
MLEMKFPVPPILEPVALSESKGEWSDRRGMHEFRLQGSEGLGATG